MSTGQTANSDRARAPSAKPEGEEYRGVGASAPGCRCTGVDTRPPARSGQVDTSKGHKEPAYQGCESRRQKEGEAGEASAEGGQSRREAGGAELQPTWMVFRGDRAECYPPTHTGQGQERNSGVS